MESELAALETRVETLIAAMLQDPLVRLPGERRAANRDKAAREGLALAPDLLARIRTLAGVTAPA